MGTTTFATGKLYCSQCGQAFAQEDLIRHGAVYVCAACKPMFLQRLAEGVEIDRGRFTFGGFGIRLGALILDGIIMWIVNITIGLAIGLTFGEIVGITPRASTAAFFFVFVIQLAIPAFYEIFMIGKFGATLGKMACHLKVVKPDGSPLSYLQSVGRYFAKFLSSLTLLIGFIIAAFDIEKRSLHDRICDTRVIKTNK